MDIKNELFCINVLINNQTESILVFEYVPHIYGNYFLLDRKISFVFRILLRSDKENFYDGNNIFLSVFRIFFKCRCRKAVLLVQATKIPYI